MRHKCTVDAETRSHLDVTEVGAYRYAQDETTEILMMSYKFDYEDTKIWWPFEPFPEEIIEHVNRGLIFEAHNVQFERYIWKFIIEPLYGVPVPKRWVDTQATCAYKGIPLKLEKAGEALNLSIQKDKNGKDLLNKLSKLQKPNKEIPHWHYNEDIDLMSQLADYCIQDDDTEFELGETLGELPRNEQRIWVLDQIINERGVKIDIEAVEGALKIIEYYSPALCDELSLITEGIVTKPTQAARIVKWLQANGLPNIKNLQANTVDDSLALKDQLPPLCYKVLEIRKKLGKSSTGKLETMLACASIVDDRVRGLLQYHGAGTGRWSGRLIQPQNMPRGSLEDYCNALKMTPYDCMELLISIIKIGKTDPEDAVMELQLTFGDVMEAIVTALRGMLVADEGKVFYVADFAAIEAVALAWVAGEQWKIEAFEAINRGEKYEGADDIYCATASKILRRSVTKENKPDRQIGKTAELAFGYEGGVRAWYNFDRSGTYSDGEIDQFKIKWRERHPKTVALWRGVKNAAIAAVQDDDCQIHRYNEYIAYQKVIDKAGTWLTCILPNGNRIWYYDPIIEEEEEPLYESWRYTLTYMGRNNKAGGNWGRVSTYGGMLTQNFIEGIARAFMVEAMIRVEAAGYPVVLTVHDEIIAEILIGFGSIKHFAELMRQRPIWAKTCPIGVSEDITNRYRKL